MPEKIGEASLVPPTRCQPTGFAAEGRVDPGGAVDRSAHRDVRGTALLADILGDDALVERALEDAGYAAGAGPEAVVPHDVGRQPVTAVVQVEHGAADRGDQRVRRRPGEYGLVVRLPRTQPL